jgi:hypothetical protein
MSLPFLAILGSGLLAGAVHVVSGVDHLAALLPLAVGGRARAFGLGVRWGIGHSAGVAVIAVLALALRERLDLGLVEGLGEGLVGAVLIFIGARGIRSALRIRIHSHSHEHRAGEHAHLHVHAGASEEEHAHDPQAHGHRHTALAAGMLHGVAGSAHFLGVLPAVALPTMVASFSYVAAFAAGTILAMGAFAALVGEGTSRAFASPHALQRTLLAASIVTILVGAGWLLVAGLGPLGLGAAS